MWKPTGCSARRRSPSIASAEAHPTLFKALGVVGLGRNRVVKVPVDEQGRMRADALPAITGPTIVCVAGGEREHRRVRSDRRDLRQRAREAGAWVHVDGAFGLWARVAPTRAHLVAGRRARRLVGDRLPQVAQRAVRQRHRLRARRGCAAEVDGDQRRVPADGDARTATRRTTRPSCRVARGAWTSGPRCARSAARAWRRWSSATAARRGASRKGCRRGLRVLNDVVLNQVLVSFGDAERTRRVIADDPGRRNAVGGRDRVAGAHGDADQRDQLGHHGRRCGDEPGGHRPDCGGAESNRIDLIRRRWRRPPIFAIV